MGHMKWIFDMIVDGSYEDFKKEYIKCVLTNENTFNWGSKNIAKSYGKSVVKYVDEHLMHEYDRHIETQAESLTY
jgi:hypothetical protein|tara:strand:- start:1987 stop:2211 length:225 start_codon:yes stop_codon:yes gene_type:complete